MDMKTLTGSSIQAALAKAREQLGDHVVLIESTPATDDRPAQIAVMVDEPAAEAASGQPSRKHVPKPPDDMPASTSGAGRHTGGSSGASRSGYENETTDSKTTTAEELQERFGTGGGENSGEGGESGSPLSRQQKTGRGRLFPTSGSAEDTNDWGGPSKREKMVEARHQRLKDRLGRTGPQEGVVDAERWAAHPLFGTLLEAGMRPDTVAQLFDDLAERGVDLEESNPDDLRWAFSQVLCRRIETSSSDPGEGALVLIGPGGAGKTSLGLKLATHNNLFGDRDPTVIHLLPEEDRGIAYQNPTGLYRRFGLPVQGVRTKEEMMKALNRIDHLAPVIVDTPALPLPLEEARPVLRRFEHLLRPLLPMEVHFVMSATHAFDSVDPGTLGQLPLTPQTTALTHLDEVRSWGRVAEWLLELELPVQFVSDGPRVPEGGRAFSLRWFVEDVMDL